MTQLLACCLKIDCSAEGKRCLPRFYAIALKYPEPLECGLDRNLLFLIKRPLPGVRLLAGSIPNLNAGALTARIQR
jgi:hypothetical protein